MARDRRTSISALIAEAPLRFGRAWRVSRPSLWPERVRDLEQARALLR